MNDNDAANLQLSPEEMRLVSDPGWILTKNSIVGKVVGMLAGLGERYGMIWEEGFAGGKEGFVVGEEGLCAGGNDVKGGKISKGENYKGLPYVILDYPRLFGKEDVLAIRTMFWWGHAFMTTLHLKGCYRALYLPVIRERWSELAAAGFYIGISEDEWRHEHVPENYRPMGDAGRFEDGDRPKGDGWLPEDGERPFLKLSARCGLDRWGEAPMILEGHFRVLVDVLSRVSDCRGKPGTK
jgi:hypothetical protein